MREFIRIRGNEMDFCYLVRVSDGFVYYGHIIQGHENKEATAVLTVPAFNSHVKAGHIIGIGVV